MRISMLIAHFTLLVEGEIRDKCGNIRRLVEMANTVLIPTSAEESLRAEVRPHRATGNRYTEFGIFPINPRCHTTSIVSNQGVNRSNSISDLGGTLYKLGIISHNLSANRFPWQQSIICACIS